MCYKNPNPWAGPAAGVVEAPGDAQDNSLPGDMKTYRTQDYPEQTPFRAPFQKHSSMKDGGVEYPYPTKPVMP